MYLDPSFGGMLLQVVVVIVAVGGALVYSFRRKIRELFSKNKDSGSGTGADTAANESVNTENSDDMIDTLSDESED